MNGLEDKVIDCPYCGEQIEVLFDCSVAHQNYIEDCAVCCRPIVFDVSVSMEGDLSVVVRNENE